MSNFNKSNTNFNEENVDNIIKQITIYKIKYKFKMSD